MKGFVLSVVTLVLLAVCTGSATGSRWDATVTKMNGDTVWVQVVVDYEGWIPCGGNWEYICDAYVNLKIDPCPLSPYSRDCLYEQTFSHTLWPSPVTLQLLAGVAYTFGGDAVAFVGHWDPTTNVCHITCQESNSFALVDFSAPVAARSETWGEIKDLYR
jgi:hypothetical protein